MANYCENHLTITGRREDLEAFRDAAAEINKHGESDKPIPLSFHKLVPIPDHIEALSDEYDVIALWMSTNWGCRGGAIDTEHCFFCDNESGGQLVYEFLTKWTAPSMFVEAVSAKYPRLHIDCLSTRCRICRPLYRKSRTVGSQYQYQLRR